MAAQKQPPPRSVWGQKLGRRNIGLSQSDELNGHENGVMVTGTRVRGNRHFADTERPALARVGGGEAAGRGGVRCGLAPGAGSVMLGSVPEGDR